MLPDQQSDKLSGETSSILRFGIDMACGERISNPSSSRLAVGKTKDISCDCASQLLSRLKNCCHHVSAESGVNSCDGASHLLGPSLCDENVEDSCDVASRVPFAGYTS